MSDSGKRPQLHATALSMRCFEAFRRRYIEGEIIPPGVAMIVGSGVDASVTRNLGSVIESGGLLPEEEVLDTARDAVVATWDRGVKLDEEEIAAGIAKTKAGAIDKAVRLSKLHAREKAPGIRPTKVQRRWSLGIPGYPFDLVGTLDIQEGVASVRDTKTSGKTPAADIADRSLQLSAYSLAVSVIDGAPPEKVALDYLIDTKIPKAETFQSTRGPQHFNALLARVEVFAVAMEKGVFIPVEPEHWCCDPKWCGYAESCRYYVSKPKQFAA